MWDPLSSSILQVLVSLQGLVLNSKPYFNEAGYDKQIGTAEGEKNSLAYNENTFLLNCKTMLNLMRKPPKVKSHSMRPVILFSSSYRICHPLIFTSHLPGPTVFFCFKGEGMEPTMMVYSL